MSRTEATHAEIVGKFLSAISYTFRKPLQLLAELHALSPHENGLSMGFRVLNAGLFSLVVDAGRPGWRGCGVPMGGAADRRAWRLGNALLGNPYGAAALEITLAGPVLEAECSVCGVLLGAEFGLFINDHPWLQGKTFQLQSGDRLAVGAAQSGVRAYLCVRGGFENAPRLGSRTAFAPIAIGDQLSAQPSRGRSGRRMAQPLSFSPVRTLRLLPGSHLPPDTRKRLTCDEFTVTADSNRQGLRLAASPPLSIWPEELTSAPVCPGTIQLPSDGQPILLGVDAQTIGGYPRAAHVITADLDELGQLSPGARLRFAWTDEESAALLLQRKENELRTCEAWLRAAAC